jgi:hypothetical protein
MLDLVGYLATLFVVLSFVVKGMLRLRIINSIGCILWITYGILLSSIPVIFTNVCIISTHVFWFYKQYKEIKE